MTDFLPTTTFSRAFRRLDTYGLDGRSAVGELCIDSLLGDDHCDHDLEQETGFERKRAEIERPANGEGSFPLALLRRFPVNAHMR